MLIHQAGFACICIYYYFFEQEMFFSNWLFLKIFRRMFPAMRVKISGLDPRQQYYIAMDIVPVDNKRYRWEMELLTQGSGLWSCQRQIEIWRAAVLTANPIVSVCYGTLDGLCPEELFICFTDPTDMRLNILSAFPTKQIFEPAFNFQN